MFRSIHRPVGVSAEAAVGRDGTDYGITPAPASSASFIRRGLQFLLRDANVLIGLVRLPRHLVTSRGHDLLLARSRSQTIAVRLRVTAIFLAFATVAWFPVDLVLFETDWAIALPLGLARVLAAVLFLAIASVKIGVSRSAIATICLVIAVGIGFFFLAHSAISAFGAAYIDGPGHAQYLLLPIAFAAGLAIFPLTLLEAIALSILPLVALVIETLHGDGAMVLPHGGVAVLLMISVMVTAITCAASQLQLLTALHESSTVDTLTGGLSRRAGADLLNLMFDNSRRSDQPMAVALIDLDLFKSVNDQFGHQAGDVLLREVSENLKGALGSHGALIRWGGEEFLVVMPNTSSPQATARLSDAWCSIGCLRLDGARQTASIGLAERYADAARDWQHLVSLADERMYAAKRLGRDRINAPYAMTRRLLGGVGTVMLPAGQV